jgi:uncharacterized protein YjbI with pentapeptide repeats
MDQAQFRGANLTNVSFDFCTLKNADFSNSILKNSSSISSAHSGFSTIFESANFTGANLQNANLEGQFQFANFSHAHFKHTTLISRLEDGPCPDDESHPSDSSVCWQGVNFSYTDLSQVIFANDEDPKKPDFTKAILCHTIMPDESINNRACKK